MAHCGGSGYGENCIRQDIKKLTRSSPVVQWVKDLALSLQRFGSLLWPGFDYWPLELPRAVGRVKNKI